MQKKNGISLIVLVITIVIMIILAATIIISLTNNGIIDKANEAVDKTNEKQVEELVNLAWADAYADNVGKSETELQETLYNAVEKVLNDNKIDTSKYYVDVTTTGVTLGWVQKSDKTIVRGNQVLEIGDSINYHDAANEDKTEKYTGGWKVLGAENGKIKILSNSIVDDDFEINLLCSSGVKGNFNIISKLNEESTPYGTGYGATGARCVTIEDIDSVTGYNKSNYNKGQINEYGNEVTYYWDNDPTNATKPYYEYTNKETGELVTGNLTSEHTLFSYYLNNEIKKSTRPSSITSKQIIASFKSTYYTYHFSSLLNQNDTKEKKIYDMLCNSRNSYDGYWLASSFIYTNNAILSWGIYCVNYLDYIGYENILTSKWDYNAICVETLYHGIRVVVELKSNVVLNGSSETGWSIV